MIKTLPIIIMPLIMALCGIAILKKADMYDEFIDGIKEGISSALKLLPTLIGLMTAVGVFNASGAAQVLADICAPALEMLGVPGELVPLLIVRPVSGSAANALLDSIFTNYGPDSFVGLCASVIAASSDTAVYITALLFGSAGIRKTGAALPCALTVSAFTVFISCAAVRLMLL